MTTLITGGAGMLGSELVRQLLATGVKHPVVMDIAATPERLEDVSDRVRYVQGNVGDAEVLNDVIGTHKPTRIYHLGAMLGITCEENPIPATEVNALGFVHLLEAAKAHNVSQVIFASSVTTFGDDMVGPSVTDITLQRPTTVYGITKLFAEHMGRLYRARFGLDFRAIRFPSITGVGLRPGGIVNYTSAMIEDSIKGRPSTVMVTPETCVSLVYVKDAARALLELANAPAENIQTICYLLDGPRPTPTTAQMADLVREHLPGARIDFEPNETWKPLFDKFSLPLDDAPARNEWGWKPVYDYEATIQDFIRILR
ncbi:NAD-dependent epimerase/dehydratase family protein [Rhodobacteraceae bacterium LMO-12]|nr:NAD-dependent epimerase/dehydratase family protein [Rhodobacteraceae bacterium LMO-JJ12]